ncbi:Tn7-like transposition protein D [Azospirillum brasilense]|uniref:Tn7-like transposition protein D n=1 Tax=Azospirillum brasilense TaxID=192 RepID=A0A560B1G6_AZOBR|nr:TnsD family Tn7-like transposition protein [Azospirillum brasilense]TWA66474.1 Tn7-like transposition protein D [Azospirillum brasilense]
MLPYFPASYPDELLYSVLARFHRHTCSVSPKRTMDDLFGNRDARATVDLPGHLGSLSRRLPSDRGLTPERLAVEFTLFPYHTAFQPSEVVGAVLAAMTDGPASGIHTRLGITASTVVTPATLRYCLACHAEAFAHRGERFWRRAHQLPGVLVCPDHGIPLMESKSAPGSGHQTVFIAADDCVYQGEPPTPPWADDDGCRAILLEIAGRSAALLSATPRGVDPAGLTAGYRHALTDRRLASANGRVDQRQLHNVFDAVFAPARKVILELANTLWLSPIVRKHQHAFHPLHHILFGLFLDQYEPAPPPTCRPPRRQVATAEFLSQLRVLVNGGDGICTVARTLGVDPSTVRLHAAKLGLITPWRPPIRPQMTAKEDPGPAMRERWLELQQQEPHLRRKALADRLPNEHAWLYRHDRTWLDAHSPAPGVRPPPVARQDWTAIDQNLAAAMRKAAKAILLRVPPVRVTLAELERRLGCPGWIGNRRAKLPETLSVLEAVRDSVEAFQLRRLTWACDVLDRSDASASKWRVRRLAGLSNCVSDAVRQAPTSIEPQNGRVPPCR